MSVCFNSSTFNFNVTFINDCCKPFIALCNFFKIMPINKSASNQILYCCFFLTYFIIINPLNKITGHESRCNKASYTGLQLI